MDVSTPGFPYGPPATLSPLAPPETPVLEKTVSVSAPEPCRYPVLNETFRHSGWQRRRQLVLDALDRTFAKHHRVAAFCQCGGDFWVLRNKAEPDRFKVVPDFCHDRLCLPCSAIRAARIRRNLASKLLPQTHRFLTLTVRSNGEPLAKLLDHLYRSFRRLRQKLLWKERVYGGVAFLEVTCNSLTGGWHPHLHCILEGLYIDRPDLTKLWLACTGDSHHVHLRRIHNQAQLLRYVTKYSTKALPASVLNVPWRLDEALVTLADRRLVVCFGRWRKWKLLADPADKDWALYCHGVHLRTLADGDDDLMLKVAAALSASDPETGEFTVPTNVDPPAA